MAAVLLRDALWDLIEPLLSAPPLRQNAGRPRIFNRACLTGILFVLRSGIRWQMLPKGLAADRECIPLAIRLTGANRNDPQEALALVDAIPPLQGKRGRPLCRPVCVIGGMAESISIPLRLTTT